MEMSRKLDPSGAFIRKWVAEKERAPAFLFLGGDSHGHVPPARDGRAAVSASHEFMAAELRAAFPATPVLPVLGNYDTWPYYSPDATARRALARRRR